MRTRERITMITDMTHACQATSKSLSKYIKALRKEAGILAEGAGDMSDFLKDFGNGI